MGEAAGEAATVASIGSLALSAGGTLMKGEGDKAAADFKAANLERAAEFGRVQASLTDTTMRENLNITLGNIEAIRAAAHTDPTSPTGAAILDWQEHVGNRQRTAAVESLKAQADQDVAGAAYLRKAGDAAVTASYVSAAAGAAGGVAKAFGKGGVAGT